LKDALLVFSRSLSAENLTFILTAFVKMKMTLKMSNDVLHEMKKITCDKSSKEYFMHSKSISVALLQQI
jgi:hypothetical protein